MNLYALKNASRPLLFRRPKPPHPLNRQINITKRHQQQQQQQQYRTNSKPPNNQETGAINNNESTTGTTVPVPATVAIVPLWQRLGPLTSAFSAYGRSQRKRPLLTQFITSLVIYFCGDMAAQQMSGEDYDAKRTGRALIIGAGSSIPSYKWFIFLSTHFNYPSTILSLLTKVTINQLFFTPIFNSYFFGMQSLLSGDSLQEIWTRIQRTVPTSFINSCKLWPGVTAFSFSFISPQYRSVFSGVIAIGWQTYLSFLNREAEEVEGAEQVIPVVMVKKEEAYERKGQVLEI